MDATVNPIDPTAITRQLDRILSSREFVASERNRRFLKYVVEETLAGREDRIKGYAIATSVFGRSEKFDSQVDPIVRIEASRLRRAVEMYYLSAGRNDRLRITIPKGTYVPIFSLRADLHLAADAPIPAPSADRSTRSGIGPSILVRPFESEVVDPAFRCFASGFTRQVIIGLTRFQDIFVFGAETAQHVGDAQNSCKEIRDLNADYLLDGAVTILEDRFEVEALLIDRRSHQTIWGESYIRQLHPKDILNVRNEVADCVARTLAQPHGVMFSNKALEIDGKGPSELTTYDSIVRYYQYTLSYSREAHSFVRDSLERSIARDPDCAEALSCLSRIYSDAYRFGFCAGDVCDPLHKSRALAERAVELAPRSSHGFHALALALWFSNNVKGSTAAFQSALALNPNSTTVMADFGLRSALLMDWDTAIPMLEASFERNPAQSSSYRMGFSLYHFVHGRFAEALGEAEAIHALDVVYSHLARAIALARLGRQREAEVAVARILEIDPVYGDHVLFDLGKRNVHPELAESVVEALAAAGLLVGSRPIQMRPGHS